MEPDTFSIRGKGLDSLVGVTPTLAPFGANYTNLIENSKRNIIAAQSFYLERLRKCQETDPSFAAKHL
jgi:hypothetical protein